MNNFKLIYSITAVFVLLTACDNVEFQKTSAGVPYKVFHKGKGDSIKLNYFVKYEVMQKIKDSVMFSSYAMKQPQYVQVQPVTGPLNYMDIRSNVMEILPKARKGDSIYIVQATDSLIRQDPEAEKSGRFKKGQEIITTVRITEVFTTREEAIAYTRKEAEANASENEKKAMEEFRKDPAMQEQLKTDNKIIESYLVSKNIPTQKTEMGVYIQIQNQGEGPKPSFGKWVTVKYVGTHMDGTEFDSGTYPYQIGGQGPIPGFDNGVRQLGKGGKAKIIIPSVLGYGARGSEPRIKPNENLIFDIEILDITDEQPAPGAPPVNGSQKRSN